MPNGNTATRRKTLKMLSTSAVAPIFSNSVSAKPGAEEQARELFARSREILEQSNNPTAAKNFLQNNGFNVASKTATVNAESRSEGLKRADKEVETQSEYQPRDHLTLRIDLNYHTDTEQYFASGSWVWDHATLGPLDGVALTYKESSWAVPPNGYSSADYVDIDPNAPWTNGYAWRYHDHNHTVDNDGAGEWRSASLEMNPYDPDIDPSNRYIWLVYTQTSSPYGGLVDGLSVGYGVLMVNVTGTSMTKDTWKRDENGDDLKLSQEDADVVGCC